MRKTITCSLAMIFVSAACHAAPHVFRRTFNTEAFTGLAKTSPSIYGYAVLDYDDFDREGGGKVHLPTCKAVEVTTSTEIIPSEYRWFDLLRANCLALKRYSESRAAKRTYFPPKLTRRLVASFPATAAFVVNDEDMQHRTGKILGRHNGPVRISITRTGEARVRTDEDDSLYTIMGRADFDGDGIEDLLVRIDWRILNASGNGTELVLLSKRSASAPVVESWRRP